MRPIRLVGDWHGLEAPTMVAEAESITVEVLDMMASEARGTVQVSLRRGRLSGSAWFSRSDKEYSANAAA